MDIKSKTHDNKITISTEQSVLHYENAFFGIHLY